jgi:hypothetical protein
MLGFETDLVSVTTAVSKKSYLSSFHYVAEPEQPTRNLANRARNLLVHHCGEKCPKVNPLFEYMFGAATALNPLPLSTPLTFLPSDRAALACDSRAVQRDIDQVWRAMSLARTLAESISNERTERQERQRQTKSEGADA